MLIINEYKFINDFLNKNIEYKKEYGLKYLIGLLVKKEIKEKKKIYNVNKFKKDIVDILVNNFNFDEYKIYKIVNKIVDFYIDSSNNYNPIRDFDYIPITEKDIEIVKQFKTDREKKFIFTCIVVARLLNSNGWINISSKDLFSMANIGMTVKDKDMFINKFMNEGYIELPKKITNLSIRIKDFESIGEEVMVVDKMENIGNKIIAYLNPNKKQCTNCGKLIKIKSDKDYSTMYCEGCAREKQLEWSRNSMKKIRETRKC